MGKFKISESNTFLSASLSLSFGVMLFSSLYSMLPQSKQYLVHGGYSPQAASFLLIGLFLAGAVGIRILSAIMHHFLPSHVVDCDHSHDEEQPPTEEMEEHHHDHTQANGTVRLQVPDLEEDEDTPLLSRTTSISPPKQRTISEPVEGLDKSNTANGFVTAPTSRRPTLMPRSLTRTLTKFYAGHKTDCDEEGPCMGYSDPCGQECFRAAHRRGSILPGHNNSFQRTSSWRGSTNFSFTPIEETEDGSTVGPSPLQGRSRATTNANKQSQQSGRSKSVTHHYHHPDGEHPEPSKTDRRSSLQAATPSVGAEHHHHVPTNAFLSIGLQTSIAIALHKAPEGFITYATNHANPTLGFAVFMALFIHNITEGFAMSLPLYLALGSRFKAIAWSSLLGGVSQPLGAGVAALWFKVARDHGGKDPSEAVYGGMFAVTAGIMTSVALSLFSESLLLSHNRGTCTTFAFVGMAVLGISSALTAT